MCVNGEGPSRSYVDTGAKASGRFAGNEYHSPVKSSFCVELVSATDSGLVPGGPFEPRPAGDLGGVQGFIGQSALRQLDYTLDSPGRIRKGVHPLIYEGCQIALPGRAGTERFRFRLDSGTRYLVLPKAIAGWHGDGLLATGRIRKVAVCNSEGTIVLGMKR